MLPIISAVLVLVAAAVPLEAGDAAKRGVTAVAPWELSRVTDRARVYFDVSQSIEGFAGNQNQPHGILIRELKRILVNTDLINFEVVEFADQPSRPRRVAHFEDFSRAAKYRGVETYLPGAIDDAAFWPANGVSLILTDGVVSVSRYHGPPPSSASARGCAQGSDVTCLALSLREYIAAGRGFWIVGLRLPFRGPHYIEEGGPNLQPGGVIRGGTFPDRPFYIWIGAPSLAQGRAVLGGLLEFAAAQRLDRLAVEVSPGAWDRWELEPGARQEDVVAVSRVDKQFCPQGDLLRRFDPSGKDGGPPVIEAEMPKAPWLPFLRRSREPKFAFGLPVTAVAAMGGLTKQVGTLVRYSQKIGTNNSGAEVAFRIRPMPDAGRETKVTPTVISGSKAIMDLCLTFNPPHVTERKGKIFDLVATWNQEVVRDHPWEGWSANTDDTRELAGRTVNLDTLFGHLQGRLTSGPEVGKLKAVPLLRVKYP